MNGPWNLSCYIDEAYHNRSEHLAQRNPNTQITWQHYRYFSDEARVAPLPAKHGRGDCNDCVRRGSYSEHEQGRITVRYSRWSLSGPAIKLPLRYKFHFRNKYVTNLAKSVIGESTRSLFSNVHYSSKLACKEGNMVSVNGKNDGKLLDLWISEVCDSHKDKYRPVRGLTAHWYTIRATSYLYMARYKPVYLQFDA